MMSDEPLTPEALATCTDEEVRKAWMESDWTPGEANADALAAEMVKRDLDFCRGPRGGERG